MPTLVSAVPDFEAMVYNYTRHAEKTASEDPHNPEKHGTMQYYWFHGKRWIKTFELIAPHIEQGASVAELGGLSLISHFLRGQGCTVFGTEGNLCYPLEELQSGTYDAVLCLEVLEHIKDQEGSQPFDVHNMSGAHCMISEMLRCLKPGGIAVCTTPNGNSYAQMARIAAGVSPSFHRGHVREYTVPEVQKLFEDVGFITESIDTPEGIWGVAPELNINAMKETVRSVGGPTQYREEDIMAVFRRPQ